MRVIFCKPAMTMHNAEKANVFFESCRETLDQYVTDISYISSLLQASQLLTREVDPNDILVFFNSEDCEYSDKFLKLVKKYNDAKSRIWAIAMERDAECRRPPECISDKQSFDVSSLNENRSPLKNNMKAIAQLFSRKIISQTLSPLYRDEVMYFISHRRSDGEHIAGKLADELRLLKRDRNIYRDVVNVEVGDDAQKDIDRNLSLSDALIFLQTEEAQQSPYIMKELSYALINNIPILWIQIDNASFEQLKIRPGEGPLLCYRSEEFDCQERLIEIAEEVEEKCFKLMMDSSNQVLSYAEYFNDLNTLGKIKLTNDTSSILAYEIEYEEKTRDIYDNGTRRHYVQCFGRNPRENDINSFIDNIKKRDVYTKNDRLFLMSSRGNRERQIRDDKIFEENFDDYFMNLENVSGARTPKNNKRIILSGAFPEYDEIYKASLLEAVLVYAREIIKKGYTLVFGAHPTFQNIIFSIARLYSSDVKYSIEMHMDRAYIDGYDQEMLEDNCTLVLADGLQEMRKNMICKERSEMLICMGGKIKADKSQQGVDTEVALAQSANIPVALVGTVGGRSGEYAFERITKKEWADLNSWGNELNEKLFYNVNHRLMIQKLLRTIEGE